MKVLDPQSALLTSAEVYAFLKSTTPRAADKKIGAYEPSDLRDYKQVRQDVLRYVETVVPEAGRQKPPSEFMNEAVQRLRAFGLTKTEVYTIINLAVGVYRPRKAELADNTDGMEVDVVENGDAAESVKEEADVKPEQESDDTSYSIGQNALTLIIDSLEERFPEDDREGKLAEIINVLHELQPRSSSAGVTNDAAMQSQDA